MFDQIFTAFGKHAGLPSRRMVGKIIAQTPALSRRLSLTNRLRLGQFTRSWYGYGIRRAAELAVRLGYREVSVIEFGVAGGNGLLAMEQAASVVEEHLPVKVKVWGFDLGSGLPQPIDYRDLPYYWQPAFFSMDVPALQRRLSRAELVLGNVDTTVPEFLARPDLRAAPIGFIAFDLDYYSSTRDAFRIFDSGTAAILPRTFCYFDDISGLAECYSERTGVRLAIGEHNRAHDRQVIDRCHDFEELPIERWQNKMFIRHDFEHPRYCDYVGPPGQQQLALKAG